MDATAEFLALVTGPDPTIALDRAAALIAARATPGVDPDALVAGLDELARTCPDSTLDAVRHHLFVRLGFRGNDGDYADPRNSLLDQVLQRRLGIPITLSVVVLEVARRLGLALHGVGMPGHFLVGTRDGAFLDPFDGGVVLDADDCRRRFHDVMGPAVQWHDAFLEPVGPRAIIARILANLRHHFAATHELAALAWVLELRTGVPGVDPAERVALASVLSGLARYADAARALEQLAELGHDDADTFRRQAAALRARLN